LSLLRIVYRSGARRRVTAFHHTESRKIIPSGIVPVPCDMIVRLLLRMEALEQAIYRSRSSNYTLRQTVAEVHVMQMALHDLEEWAEMRGRNQFQQRAP
jgi:hypothetical protein